ncbi:hypothetical protein QBC44DRAFT_368457 [Cladorrhinum sp. PSN332]|nr:hypothetical protein QBC44DRAFT_368457 [Cladorrhinum sp. PSN332]
MHLSYLVTTVLFCLLGFTSLAVANDTCDVFYQKDITTNRSPTYADCYNIYTSYMNVDLTLTKETPSWNQLSGTCYISFHLGAGNGMTLGVAHMGNLWDLLGAAVRTYRDDGVARMESFGGVSCGRVDALNFEVYNPYTHTSGTTASGQRVNGTLGG